MAHFGVELRGVDLAFGAFHSSHGAGVGGGGHREARGNLRHRVAVAHPYRLLGRRFGEECAGAHVQVSCAVFALLGVADRAAQIDGDGLVPVAEAEHGQAQIEDRGSMAGASSA